MAKKRNKILPLSDFELDGIWMSYRYCIGRKTIAANMRAGDILSHCYERLKLNPERCEFTAFDICRSIEDSLRWCQLNVFINNYEQQDHIYPLDEVIKAIIDKDGYVMNIEDVKKINIDIDIRGKSSYNIERDETKKLFYPISDLHDLMVWQNCAKILDLSQHKMCKTSFEGNEEYIEYVEMYSHITEEGKDRFVIRKVPVDRYVKNSIIQTYINEEYIVEDNLSVDENLLKKE